MKNPQKIRVDENLAYFIGVLQSDGCLYLFFDKKKNWKSIRLSLYVAQKSLPMSRKFKNMFREKFGRDVNIRKVPNKNLYAIQTSINSLYHIFSEWNEYKIPFEIKQDRKLFGAYLAGLIDGDGHIKIKKHQNDRALPQGLIKIASDRPLGILRALIRSHAGCSVHFDYDRNSNGVCTCFYITKKSIPFIMRCVYPHLAMQYKMEALKEFSERKTEPARI